MAFASLKLHPDLLRGLKELGFARPTPIQAEAIPELMTGKDLLATAMTGSGKTAAFLLPMLHQLIGRPRGKTRGLVLTPTRELAAQIVEESNSLSLHTPIGAAAIYGGVGMGPQEHAFRKGVDLLVATPGRLLDHLRYPYAKFTDLEFLVLDEADRMLDMGFLPEIRKILQHLPSKRQTMLFSATMPNEIAQLSRQILRQPVTIAMQRTTAPAVGITQAVYPVPQNLKSALLAHLLNRGDVVQALVFTRTKHRADRLAKFCQREKIRAERIHGNRSQRQRTEALAGFKSGKFSLLVATDIMARGIDVEALQHVVNFDVPRAPEDYVHRIGRTGRAEQSGEAITFVSKEEEGELRRIELALGKKLPRVTVPDFDYKAKAAEGLEIPLADRIAAIKEQRARARQKSAAKSRPNASPSARGSRDSREWRGAHDRAEPRETRDPRSAGAPRAGHGGRGAAPREGIEAAPRRPSRFRRFGSRPAGDRPQGTDRPHGAARPAGDRPRSSAGAPPDRHRAGAASDSNRPRPRFGAKKKGPRKRW